MLESTLHVAGVRKEREQHRKYASSLATHMFIIFILTLHNSRLSDLLPPHLQNVSCQVKSPLYQEDRVIYILSCTRICTLILHGDHCSSVFLASTVFLNKNSFLGGAYSLLLILFEYSISFQSCILLILLPSS